MLGRFYLLPLHRDRLLCSQGEKKNSYIKASLKLGEGSEVNVGTFMFCIKLQASAETSAVILWVIHLFFAFKSVSCSIKNSFRG